MNKGGLLRLTLSAMFLALALLLPFLTGQIPEIGSRLSPMHIPALLCGFVCGPLAGLAVGFIAPLLRSFLFGLPPLMPTALAMAFELAAYGAVAGLLYARLPKKAPYLYLTLIASMIVGRVVWGLVSFPIYGLAGRQFSLALFWANGFASALPGILLHIALIPPILMALERARLVPLEERIRRM